MDALAIINKYYPEENELKHILLTHSRAVADKALWKCFILNYFDAYDFALKQAENRKNK